MTLAGSLYVCLALFGGKPVRPSTIASPWPPAASTIITPRDYGATLPIVVLHRSREHEFFSLIDIAKAPNRNHRNHYRIDDVQPDVAPHQLKTVRATSIVRGNTKSAWEDAVAVNAIYNVHNRLAE